MAEQTKFSTQVLPGPLVLAGKPVCDVAVNVSADGKHAALVVTSKAADGRRNSYTWSLRRDVDK